MAPEMLILLHKPDKASALGYTTAVDWWSFGVSIAEMLMGQNPFRMVNVVDIGHSPTIFNDMLEFSREHYGLSEAAFDILTKFLQIDIEQRLGSGKSGLKNIKRQEFFKEIDWSKLGQYLVKPPFRPQMNAAESDQEFESFDAMTNELCYSLRRDSEGIPDKCFDHWWVVSEVVCYICRLFFIHSCAFNAE